MKVAFFRRFLGAAVTPRGVGVVVVATMLILSGIVFTVPVAAQEFSTDDCADYATFDRRTSFVLVVDRSGSMNGAAMENAKAAARRFLADVRPGDRVGVVSFSDDVTVDRTITDNRRAVEAAIGDLRAGGGTRLHDAIAAAVRLLRNETGLRVVVFLTDGNDNRSNLSVRDIRQMNVGENTILYGVGLGNVDHRRMRDLATATNGEYEVAGDAASLVGLYDRTRNDYYEVYDQRLKDAASVTVTSIPAGRPVYLDGEQVGVTPLRLDTLQPDVYDVTVAFDRGTWSCGVDARSGYRARVRARESQVPLSLVVETAPTRAAVFLNDDYAGLSSMVPSREVNGERDFSNQLVIPSIAPGNYTVRVVAAPEYDISPNQVMEFPVTITDRRVYVKAFIFMNILEDENGNRRRPDGGSGARRPPTQVPGGNDIFGGDDPFGDIRSRALGN